MSTEEAETPPMENDAPVLCPVCTKACEIVSTDSATKARHVTCSGHFVGLLLASGEYMVRQTLSG